MPDPASQSPDVVIVGAGIAGLVAARELAIGGVRVTVVEASSRAGGKVASHEVCGMLLDSGAESFATRGDTVRTLALELGLAASIVTPNPVGAWLYPADGKPKPLPKTGILGIPGTAMAGDVIAVVGLLGAFRAQLDTLLPGFIGSRERYLGPLVRKRMGRRLLDRLVAPVAAGIHSRHPDELEVDVVAPALRAALRDQESLAHAVRMIRAAATAGSQVAGLAGGIHQLVAAIQHELIELGVQLRFDSPVASFDPTGITFDGGERVECSRVVLAVSPNSLGRSASESDARIILATLVINSSELDAAPRGTGLLVAAGAHGIQAKALTHATAKWAWLDDAAGAGRHVLRLSFDGDRIGARSDTELQEIARTDAERLLGVALPASAVIGFARAEWFAPLPSRAEPPDGVSLIGESAAGTGLAAVIGQAQSEAHSILSSFTGINDGRGDDGEHDIDPEQ